MSLDPKWSLAALAIVGAFVVQIILLSQGLPADMPAWIVGLVSSVVAYYFGHKNGSNGVR